MRIDRPLAWAIALAVLAFAPLAGAQEPKPELASILVSNAPNIVPRDAPLVISFQPAALLKLPDLKALYEEFTRADEVRRIVDVAEPESVEAITLVLMRRDLKIVGDPGDELAAAGAVIVRTNKAREWKALAAAAGVPVVKAAHAGKEYYRVSGDVPMAFGFYQPDDMTLVVASEANLRKIIEGEKAGEPGKPVVRSGDDSSPKSLAAATVDFAWVRDLLGPQIKANPEAALLLSVVGPIWEKTDGVTIRLSASDSGGLILVADHLCADEAGAKRVEKTFEAFLTLAQNAGPEGLKLLRQQSKGDPIASEMADLGEQAIKNATVDREGTRVRVKMSVKADVAKLARLMRGK